MGTKREKQRKQREKVGGPSQRARCLRRRAPNLDQDLDRELQTPRPAISAPRQGEDCLCPVSALGRTPLPTLLRQAGKPFYLCLSLLAHAARQRVVVHHDVIYLENGECTDPARPRSAPHPKGKRIPEAAHRASPVHLSTPASEVNTAAFPGTPASSLARLDCAVTAESEHAQLLLHVFFDDTPLYRVRSEV